VSHCPAGAELYSHISEDAHAPQRSMRERREGTNQALEAYAAHFTNCSECRGLLCSTVAQNPNFAGM
jgi:hypothetical protein